MPLESRIKFPLFVQYINDAFSKNKDITKDNEYREKVGKVAKAFKKIRFGGRASQMDAKWQAWISDINNELGDKWASVQNLKKQRIDDLCDGTGALEHALAVHYRLHAELDALEYAKEIDRFVFADGKTIEEKYLTPVFVWQDAEKARLDPSYPKNTRLHDAYQEARPEFFQAKEVLLTLDETTIALTSAVYGAAGYGKSSLAQELCGDEEIQARFPGGIYWLQFGLINSNDESVGYVPLLQAIQRMLETQYPKAKIPPISWSNSDIDIEALLEILPVSPLLIIADDLWNDRQTNWITEVSGNVSVLLTTRRKDIAKRAAKQIPIVRLSDDASYRLLIHGMEKLSVEQDVRLRELAKGFKGWPLLLNLANGVFKNLDGDRIARIDEAINKYEQFLDDDQIDAWDIGERGEREHDKRRRLVGYCIEASLNAIHPSNDPDLLRAFAVFPDDVNIPFSVAVDLWAHIADKRISTTKGLILLRHFNDFSFFSSFDEDGEFLRLHDEILAYFRGSLNAEQSRRLHRHMIASLREQCSSGWVTLPGDHRYGWMHLLNHMEKADLSYEADDLRTDFYWLEAKLATVGAQELLNSYYPWCRREDARAVGDAIQSSVSVLTECPEALAHQLYGFLGNSTVRRLKKLARIAHSDPACWPTPVKPHLDHLATELTKHVDRHRVEINKTVFDPTGQKVVTTMYEKPARLWNAATGAPVGGPLDGLGNVVRNAVFDPSGQKLVTTSDDHFAHVWNAEAGTLVGRLLDGHEDDIIHAAFSPSGNKVVTASRDQTARLWDANSCLPIGVPLCGHGDIVTLASFDPTGRMVATASYDCTVRLWDGCSGLPIGKPLNTHDSFLFCAVFDGSGSKIATASLDATVRLWDTKTGLPICKPLKGHSEPVVGVAFDQSGDKIATGSLDSTVRLWNAYDGTPIGEPLEGHTGAVKGVVFHPSGRTLLTMSDDRSIRLWDTGTGKKGGVIHFNTFPVYVFWHQELFAVGVHGGAISFFQADRQYTTNH